MTALAPSRLGAVGRHIEDLILKVIAAEDARPIVWFDPGGEYEQVLAALRIDGLTLLRYEGTFFGLRQAADAHMEQPWPKLLLYIPLFEDQTNHALLEFTAAGTTLAPGMPGTHNTRLAVIARRAFHASLSEAELDKLVNDVAAGKLHLADLEARGDLQPSVLGVIYKAAQPEEIALAFATRTEKDAELVNRKAVGDLIDLLASRYGLPTDHSSPADIRRHFVSAALLTDLLISIPDSSEPALSLPLPQASEEQTHRLRELVGAWRNRVELRESYKAASQRVETESGIASLAFAPGSLDDAVTFRALEARLQTEVERRLADTGSAGIPSDTLILIENRLQNFWSTWPDLFPEVKPRWLLIRLAALTLQSAAAVEAALKDVGSDPKEILLAYTGTGNHQPWCRLDTAHRRMEQAYHNFHSFDEDGRHAVLAKLLRHARERYMDVTSIVAERFLKAWEASDFVSLGRRQAEAFNHYVAPALAKGKTAYVLVDAMRFEIALEAVSLMSEHRHPTLDHVIGTVPTITPVGMAALMPPARDGIAIMLSGKTILPSIAGTPLPDRESRLTLLAKSVAAKVASAKLEDLIPAPSKPLAAKMAAAELIVVTSQEIDKLAEGDSLHQAHHLMDEMIQDVGRLIDKLAGLGCQTIVVTADHGYLFGEELDVGAKIDPPKADQSSLHRRVWVGQGGAPSEYYMFTKLSNLGVESDLSIAVPWGIGAFKAPGARAYFHGGLSPQELVIPVLVLRPESVAPLAASGAIDWKLTPSSSQLSSAFFAVTVSGVSSGLLGVESPRVRLEVRPKGSESSVSRVTGALYGLDEVSGAIQLKPSAADPRVVENNNVMLEVISKPAADTIIVVLSDAVTGQVLKRTGDIPVAMQDWGGDKWL